MLPVSPPLRHLNFFFFFWSQALPSFMSINSAWLSFPGYTEFQMVATSAFPEWEISSITAFYIQSKFFFQHYRLSFFSLSLFWTASLWAQFPLLTTHFWKMSCGFITWKQGGTISIRFAVCVWTHRPTGTNQQQTLKEMTRSQITMLVCYLLSDPWAGEQRARFVLRVTIQGQLKSGLCGWGAGITELNCGAEICTRWDSAKLRLPIPRVRPGGSVAFGKKKKLDCSGIRCEDMPFVHSVIQMHRYPAPRKYRWVPGVELCTDEARIWDTCLLMLHETGLQVLCFRKARFLSCLMIWAQSPLLAGTGN